MNNYAGTHLIVDFFNCKNVPSSNELVIILETFCKSIGCVVIDSKYHDFDNGGSSGIILLAESHLSWHYWVDEKFIALDVFICNNADLEESIKTLKDIFLSEKETYSIIKRGKDFGG